MSGSDPDDANDRLTEEVVRLASMTSDDPDELMDLPPDVVLRLIMERGGGPDEGGAVMTMPAPHEPSPHDSAIAVPLPVEDEPN
jgi:hypothetical protein